MWVGGAVCQKRNLRVGAVRFHCCCARVLLAVARPVADDVGLLHVQDRREEIQEETEEDREGRPVPTVRERGGKRQEFGGEKRGANSGLLGRAEAGRGERD